MRAALLWTIDVLQGRLYPCNPAVTSEMGYFSSLVLNQRLSTSTAPTALRGSSRGHDEFWNANYPVLGGVLRADFNDEVLPVRIGIGQQFKHFSIQLHRFRTRISNLLEPGTDFFRGGCAGMHAAIMRSNGQNCRDRGHDGMFAHSYPEGGGEGGTHFSPGTPVLVLYRFELQHRIARRNRVHPRQRHLLFRIVRTWSKISEIREHKGQPLRLQH